ncbi:MAG: hypothetical protein KIT31_38710, partial [Deltaproteobacteria bacterium]|nr:hypothetical protein [Deltaproteobacteria bacterium]
MAARLGIFDPSGRLTQELAAAAAQAGVVLTTERDGIAALLVAPLVAGDLGMAPAQAVPRWIVGDGANPARVAGAAAQCGAAGVLLTPVGAAALEAIARQGA